MDLGQIAGDMPDTGPSKPGTAPPLTPGPEAGPGQGGATLGVLSLSGVKVPSFKRATPQGIPFVPPKRTQSQVRSRSRLLNLGQRAFPHREVVKALRAVRSVLGIRSTAAVVEEAGDSKSTDVLVCVPIKLYL